MSNSVYSNSYLVEIISEQKAENTSRGDRVAHSLILLTRGHNGDVKPASNLARKMKATHPRGSGS